MLKEQMDAQRKRTRARGPLLDALEYDCTGQIKDADLTFDQRVQYSIALSLKAISDRLERAADAGKL